MLSVGKGGVGGCIIGKTSIKPFSDKDTCLTRDLKGGLDMVDNPYYFIDIICISPFISATNLTILHGH
jgi:hypothetical protein